MCCFSRAGHDMAAQVRRRRAADADFLNQIPKYDPALGTVKAICGNWAI
jgi:hypothetical protein